jgi:hypothetical protein
MTSGNALNLLGYFCRHLWLVKSLKFKVASDWNDGPDCGASNRPDAPWRGSFGVMELVGHNTESDYHRYDIVAKRDLTDDVAARFEFSPLLIRNRGELQ